MNIRSIPNPVFPILMKTGLPTEQEVHVYGTDPTNPDTDGDGWKDGLEVQNGTDPNNFLSFPAEIAGTIIYEGRQPGPIIVMAVTGADDWTSEYSTEIPGPGPYVITNVPNLNELLDQSFL